MDVLFTPLMRCLVWRSFTAERFAIGLSCGSIDPKQFLEQLTEDILCIGRWQLMAEHNILAPPCRFKWFIRVYLYFNGRA